MKKSFILYIILLILFIFYTPFTIMNMIYGSFIPNVKIIYNSQNIQNNNKYIEYNFNHRFFDGNLMHHYIKNNLHPKIDINSNFNNFEEHQYIDSKRILDHSLFTSAISKLVYKLVNKQQKNLNICIIVSTRDTYDFGNFLQFALYTIKQSNTLEEICNIHNIAVKQIQNRKYISNHASLYDFLKLYKADYIFNSWRNLSSINTIDNRLLTRMSDQKISKTDIENLMIAKKRAFVITDFIDNSFVISQINYYNY